MVNLFNGTDTFNVIFDSPAEVQNFEIGVIDAVPQAIGKTTDLPSANKKTIVISGTTYIITADLPDGTGLTTILLSQDTDG